MKKHICFIHIGMARDGAERVIAKLANKYGENGYCVDIIVLLLDECGYELHENVRLISLVRSEYPRYRNILYWMKGIRKHIKRTKPEHVIAFSMYVNIFTILACMGLDLDILISERNDPSSDGRSKVEVILTKVLYPLAKKIVFQTKRAQNCFPEKIKHKSRIIVNPVEISCKADNENERKIVTVGRLEPQKNQMLLLNSFAKLHDDFPDITLEIYGKGGLLDKLTKQTYDLGLENSVRFMGSVSDVHYRIKNAMMFVLSSDYEGLSNALLEAMMMGLPCISTCCAGSDEVIQNGENGILTSVGNSEELYQAMKMLVENDYMRKKISANAENSASIFDSETVIKEWMDYIEQKEG